MVFSKYTTYYMVCNTVFM